MMSKVYKCDICRDEMHALELFGIRFHGMKSFSISNAASTDGVHVCAKCMAQFRHLPLPEIPELKAKVVASIPATKD